MEGLRARAEGETNGFPRRDAKGIPKIFVPDLEVNRLLLDGNISKQLFEAIPHIDEKLDPISYRRLEVIMTGAIRTQVRFNSAAIKDPQGLDFPGFALTARSKKKKPPNTSFGSVRCAMTFARKQNNTFLKS